VLRLQGRFVDVEIDAVSMIGEHFARIKPYASFRPGDQREDSAEGAVVQSLKLR